MTPAVLQCTSCGSDVPVEGDTSTCPDCGETYPTEGLAGSSAPAVESEKEEQLAGRRLMEAVRPDAAIYDTSQPHQAKITPGVPDWIVFTPEEGLFFFEWKREGGRLSDPQRRFRALCRQACLPYKCGTRHDLARFLDLEET